MKQQLKTQMYTLKPCGTKQTAANESVIISTKIGKCDICKVKKKIFVEHGFTLCEDCLTICTGILEQLQFEKQGNCPVKKRVEVTVSYPYVECMSLLIKDGLYESQTEIIKDALRRLFNHYEIQLVGDIAVV